MLAGHAEEQSSSGFLQILSLATPAPRSSRLRDLEEEAAALSFVPVRCSVQVPRSCHSATDFFRVFAPRVSMDTRSC